jgi:hypothetical protein
MELIRCGDGALANLGDELAGRCLNFEGTFFSSAPTVFVVRFPRVSRLPADEERGMRHDPARD